MALQVERKVDLSSIFLSLTVELAGEYALVGILCLIRHVRWYVGNYPEYLYLGTMNRSFISVSLTQRSGIFLV